ncbi:MAG: hypothetical protein RIC89_09120 [Pseudomonadales bacterium]
MSDNSQTIRRSMFPQEGDSWESIAAREFPDQEIDSIVAQLQSWNMHVFMRPAAPAGSPRAGNPILPSDVIFLAPPVPATANV